MNREVVSHRTAPFDAAAWSQPRSRVIAYTLFYRSIGFRGNLDRHRSDDHSMARAGILVLADGASRSRVPHKLGPKGRFQRDAGRYKRFTRSRPLAH